MAVRVIVTPVPTRTTSVLGACLTWHLTFSFDLDKGLASQNYAWNWNCSLFWLFSNAMKFYLRPCFFPWFNPKNACASWASGSWKPIMSALLSSEFGLCIAAGTDWVFCSMPSCPLSFFMEPKSLKIACYFPIFLWKDPVCSIDRTCGIWLGQVASSLWLGEPFNPFCPWHALLHHQDCILFLALSCSLKLSMFPQAQASLSGLPVNGKHLGSCCVSHGPSTGPTLRWHSENQKSHCLKLGAMQTGLGWFSSSMPLLPGSCSLKHDSPECRSWAINVLSGVGNSVLTEAPGLHRCLSTIQLFPRSLAFTQSPESC